MTSQGKPPHVGAEATPADPPPRSPGMSGNLKGIGWMVASSILFVGVTGTVRYLGSDMNPAEAAFIRYCFGLMFFAPVLWRLRHAHLRSPRTGLHALRGVLHATGVILWFYAIARIPIAEVTALGFIAPIFTTIGAAMFLGERLRARRVAAVILGFAGTLVILRPGIAVVDIGALAQVAAAPLFAASFIITKKLTETDSNVTIVAYMSVFVTLALAPPALMDWRTPTFEELGWLFATAVFATLSHLCLTQALRSAELTVTQPISFLQLVWATLLGIYMFGEVPDLFTWIGAAIIVASATYIAHREVVARRREQ